MSLICLWSPGWETGAGATERRGEPGAESGPPEGLLPLLLEEVPRLAFDAGRGVVWADARGLPTTRIAVSLLGRLGARGVEGGSAARAGVAAVGVAAELAARSAEAGVRVVRAGGERQFLAPLSLELLRPDPRLLTLLDGVGVQHCGQLAALEREAVEVRFGAEGVELWRLVRADDRRRFFAPIPPERSHASFDFLDYEVRDARRLIFTLNALLESVCATLRERGDRARALVLELPLAGGGSWSRTLRAALSTSERDPWLRRLRDLLDRIRLPDAVTGVSLRVDATEPAAATQGDLFDRGFASRGAVEVALARLIDGEIASFVAPDFSRHPLPERRTRWRAQELVELIETRSADATLAQSAPEPKLTLQLLPEPRAIRVQTRRRRDHLLPVRYRVEAKGARPRWYTLVTAAGPERISGGEYDERPFAREYFRCVDDSGTLLWLFRDALAQAHEGGESARSASAQGDWYLQGWWE
jgi:nucleotidyltransferase/DNA polymerase involved in DNA repair